MTPERSRARKACVLGVLLFLAWAYPAWADLSFPALTGRVVDAAHVLDPAAIAALDGKLASQEAKGTDQLVVATVPSLGGTSVEDYANRLFRFWKLGQEKKNNGVLLLVAPNERKVRIEVGYGLEGVLPDAVASTIIRTTMLPLLRRGDYAGATDKGADGIIEILTLDPAELAGRGRRDSGPTTRGMDSGDWEAWLLVGAFLLVWILVFRSASRRPAQSRTVGRSGFGRGPVIVPWVFPGGRESGGSGGGFGGGGFSGGGGSSGGGGASGSW